MIAFVLGATAYGPMLIPRMDYGPGWPGVGGQLLDTGAFDLPEIELCLNLLALRRRYRGDNLLVVDGGANIGTHTLAMARAMTGWGRVWAVEAQERLFYALCGNIALNNLTNATALHRALAGHVGTLEVPQPDYTRPGSFGSVELGEDRPGEFIGQELGESATVACTTLDALPLIKLDFLKLDIEGMELAVLHGGEQLIKTFHPIMLIERVKSDDAALRAWLTTRGYTLYPVFLSYLAVHESDPCRECIQQQE